MEYKKLNMGGYNLHLIKTDRFKMCHVEVIFRNNFNSEDIVKRKFISKILCESSMEYPTRRKLLLKFEDLYNASIYSYTSRVGSSFISNFCADFLNPYYTEKDMPRDTIKLLFDIIFNPLVRNNEFDNKTFEIIKNRVKDGINSLKENPSKVSVNNALKLLGDTPAAYTMVGSLKELDNITPENLYDYYLNMINNDYIDIFVVGDLDMNLVKDYIDKYAKFKIIKNHDVSLYASVNKKREKIGSDITNNVQTNITMVLNFSNLTDYESRYVMNVYNIILGGGSLQTKLYKKLRGENSLCYTISSYYQKYDGLLLITTGVDFNSKDKAIKLIKECIKEMSNKVSEEELENAKKSVISSVNSINDSIDRISNNYYFESLGELEAIEDRVRIYKDVSLADIYALNKKMNIAVTYSLEGGLE